MRKQKNIYSVFLETREVRGGFPWRFSPEGTCGIYLIETRRSRRGFSEKEIRHNKRNSLSGVDFNTQVKKIFYNIV